jgi:hypothetical protein
MGQMEDNSTFWGITAPRLTSWELSSTAKPAMLFIRIYKLLKISLVFMRLFLVL